MKFTLTGPARRLTRAAAVPAFAGLALCGLLLAAGGCGSSSSNTPVVITFEAPSTSVAPGGTMAITINVQTDAGDPAPDGTQVELSQNPSLGTLAPTTVTTAGGKALSAFTAGGTVGTTVITARSGDDSTDLTITVQAGGGGGGGGGGGSDAIDLAQVTWTDANPSGYPVDAQLRGIRFELPNVCWEYVEWPDYWPNYKNQARGANANQIVIGYINGRWYGGAWEALPQSYSGKGGCRVLEVLQKKENLGPFGQVEDGPFFTWYPASGEKIGFMMTTFVRNFQVPKGPTGRSKVVTANWP